MKSHDERGPRPLSAHHTPARQRQTGQVLPLVALLLVAILGMAALAIDGSNLYAQHRRIQADLDVVVKSVAANMYDVTPGTTAYTTTLVASFQLGGHLLASEGYPNTLGAITVSDLTTTGANTCATSGGIRFCDPPTRGPYVNVSAVGANYVEGIMDEDITGFFGGVLGLPRLHVSARAVAKTGGYAEPYALIGLSSTAGCSIQVQVGSSTVLVVAGSTMSNDQACVGGSAAPTVYGSSNMAAPSATAPITGAGGTNYNVPLITDPFSATMPTTAMTVTPLSMNSSADVNQFANTHTNCWNEFTTFWETQGVTPTTTSLPSAAQGTYYFYPYTTTATMAMTTVVQIDLSGSALSSGSFYLMPACDGSATGTPGAYELINNYHPSGTAIIGSYNAVTFFNQSVLATGHASLALNGPTSGPYQGLALVQQRGYDASGALVCPSPPVTLKFAGISSTPLRGVFDAPCADITGIGNSTTTVDGAVIGNTVTVQGSANDVVTYDTAVLPKDKGSVLVE